MNDDRNSFDRLVNTSSPVHRARIETLRPARARHRVLASGFALAVTVLMAAVAVLALGNAYNQQAQRAGVRSTTSPPAAAKASATSVPGNTALPPGSPATPAATVPSAATQATPTPGATSTTARPDGPAAYVLGGIPSQGSAVWRIDPLTLEPGRKGSPVTVDSPTTSWLVSRDGSTLAVTSGGACVTETISIVDTATYSEKARFTLPQGVLARSLTPNGTRLLGFRCADGTFTEAYTFDTRNGNITGRARLDPQCCWPSLLDPSGTRLYSLSAPATGGRQEGPSPATVTAFDLTSGRETGRVELKGTRIGSWRPAGSSSTRFYQDTPGFALSPDGRTLAVVDGSRDVLTLLDAPSLKVRKTLSIARKAGWLERLGLASAAAEAKEMIGTTVEAQFSLDGRSLYVTGQRGSVEQGKYSLKGLGVRLVDVATGTVLAQALDGQRFWWTLLSPDGSSYYTLGPVDPSGTSDGPVVMRRLDTRTLGLRAERGFPEYYQLYLLGK